MSDTEPNDLVAFSRRALIGVASAAPFYGVGNGPTSPDDLAVSCKEWLAIDGEIDGLSRRWARLESRMVRDFNWFALSPEERRSIPQAREMFELEEGMDQLSDERERRLTSLVKLKAKDLHGVGDKLAVAARLLQYEGGPAYRLVADAVDDLAARRCPACRGRHGAIAERP
jgi:hypothetical protein